MNRAVKELSGRSAFRIDVRLETVADVGAEAESPSEVEGMEIW